MNITPRLTAPTCVCVCVCVYIYIYVRIRTNCRILHRQALRDMHKECNNARLLGCWLLWSSGKGRGAGRLSGGRASGWRNEWAECACVGGTRGSYTCLQLPRLGNEGQSSPGLRAGEDKSRGNERVNRFAACTSFSSASSLFLLLLFGGLIDFR